MSTWLEDIINAIIEVGGIAHFSEIYEYIKQNTTRTSKVAWRQATRQTIYDHSSDAKHFKGREDIFYVIGRIGSGTWGLRPEWTKEKGLSGFQKVNQDVSPVKTGLSSKYMLSGDEDYVFERIGKTTYSLTRNANRSNKLKELYDFACQVCGKSIQLKKKQLYAETHHIRPRNEHNGGDFWDNMVVLCPNHHVEFDNGVLCIDPDTLCFHHKYDKDVNGKKLHLSGEHRLKKEYLEYAKKMLYN